MVEDEKYMERCLELARNGLGHVAPNPMVGAVIVSNGKIIGEGFHKVLGGPHAEIEAINSVKGKASLKGATIYVNLEPCSHYGKTPPCSDAIIKCGFGRVVIGCLDSNPKVAGEGVKKLRKAGIEVNLPVMEADSRFLNRRFFTFHEEKRPYVILKWAESKDGFIAPEGDRQEWITGEESQLLVHKWRTVEQSIMVGRRTAEIDNPKLTARKYPGNHPTRILVDPELKVQKSSHLFNSDAPTLVFNARKDDKIDGVEFIKVDFEKDPISDVLKELGLRGIQSVIVEGGGILLRSFIDSGIWDEMRIFVGEKEFKSGIPSPKIDKEPEFKTTSGKDQLFTIFKKKS